jgi:N-acetylglucosaminyldiphosphoundecaprenol N-acetyl-beta-D-mannosaminyltransferase
MTNHLSTQRLAAQPAEKDGQPLRMQAAPSKTAIPRFSLLGLPVNALTKDDLVGLVAEAIGAEKSFVIGNHNLHSLYVARQAPRMRQFYARADFAHVDGMSLVLIGRLLGLPLTRRHRTGYMDLLPPLMRRAAESGWRVFYLGSKPGVAEKGARLLRAQYPGLQIAVHDGYFDASAASAQNREALAAIRAFTPHVLLVGMGMPRQEAWILENRPSLAANAIFPCGALIDYVAGEIPTPPRWIGQIGFEWLYRLLAEPRRLAHRYLIEPWSVLLMVLQELLSPERRNAARRADREDPAI